MTTAEILAEHPGLTEGQIVRYEAATSDKANEPLPDGFYCDALVWVRDEGNNAIMKATRYVTVRVNHIRNCQYSGAVFITMNANDTLALRRNDGGCDYDGYSC